MENRSTGKLIRENPSEPVAERLLQPLEAELVQLLQNLVRTNSVAIPPNGSETAGQRVLLEFLQAHDIEAETYDLDYLASSDHPYVRADRNYSGRQNLIARLPGRAAQGRSLMLSGHIDTVPPGRNKWDESPWSGSIQGDRLYGRGSYDMKGGLVAGIGVTAALKEAGMTLEGDLFFESVVDEEWGGGGGTLAARLRGHVADACVIPEPTDLAIFRASRGGYVVDIEVQAGDSQNYFSKEEVVSPAIPMGRLLQWVDTLSSKRKGISTGEAYQGFVDPAPVQVLALEASSFDLEVPLSTPLAARARLYFQFLPHEDVSAIIVEIKDSFYSFCAKDPFFSVYPSKWTPFFDPALQGHEVPLDHDWTRTLSMNATRVMGHPAVVTAAEYPCDAFLNQRYFGMPTLIFGPRGGGAHNANEFVELSSVMNTARVLLSAALEWCGVYNADIQAEYI
ncbi:MAG TPA: M20/M25/M40 family metallo-hydrolase [Pyrinomonadaceae bacterium]|nr:M20/M25/M40 family metallo-hydrolase [Pyrinomonadaceae bacterium]